MRPATAGPLIVTIAPSSSLLVSAERTVPFRCPTVGIVFHNIGGVATAVAIVPGLVLHGSGHFAAGERATGWRLLGMEGVGLGLTAVGLATLEMQVMIPAILRMVELRAARPEPERFDVLGVTLVPSRGGEIVVKRHLTESPRTPAAVGAAS